MHLDKDKLYAAAALATELTADERTVLREFLLGPVGVKVVAELIVREGATKDTLVTLDYTKPEGISAAIRAQGWVQGLRDGLDHILSLAEEN